MNIFFREPVFYSATGSILVFAWVPVRVVFVVAFSSALALARALAVPVIGEALGLLVAILVEEALVIVAALHVAVLPAAAVQWRSAAPRSPVTSVFTSWKQGDRPTDVKYYIASCTSWLARRAKLFSLFAIHFFYHPDNTYKQGVLSYQLFLAKAENVAYTATMCTVGHTIGKIEWDFPHLLHRIWPHKCIVKSLPWAGSS